MNTKEKSSSDPTLARLPGLLPELEALYTDVHAHPELSMQETRTDDCEYELTIVKTGSQNVSIRSAPVAFLVSRTRPLFASTAADDCKHALKPGQRLA